MQFYCALFLSWKSFVSSPYAEDGYVCRPSTRQFFRPKPSTAHDTFPLSSSYKSKWSLATRVMKRVDKVPRVVMAAPINFVPVRAVTIVQEIFIDETFGRPWARHKYQLARFLIRNIVLFLIINVVDRKVAVGRWHVNRYVFCGRQRR